ncbi:MAG TPA: hypothetical protein VJZ93_03875 [Candidatus Nanoarchaeia archaeon]|nr:hypothetical protein [Candidatus Nanoarchaeia archaeon]
MDKKRTTIIITILTVLVVILGGIMLYLFLVKPAVADYQGKLYGQGANDAVNFILTQISQKGYVQIQLNDGTLLTLAPYLQQPSDSGVATIETQTAEEVAA